jgi:hypothetical protein
MSSTTIVTEDPESAPVALWHITPRIVMAAFLPLYVGIGANSLPGQHDLLGRGAVVVIWAVALVAGSVIAQSNLLRWFGFSWVVSLLFPGLPMLLLMAGGALVNKRRDCLRAALLGLLVFPLAGLLPAHPHGVMLIVCAFLLTLSTERS